MDIAVTERFNKELKKLRLSKDYALKIKNMRDELQECTNLYDTTLNIASISGQTNIYRVRIGRYRIGMHAKDNLVTFLSIRLRDDKTYKGFP